jgi:hypothetical protein
VKSIEEEINVLLKLSRKNQIIKYIVKSMEEEINVLLKLSRKNQIIKYIGEINGRRD